MKVTIPKNKILPLIIFAVFSILISLLLSLYHMNRMAEYSYKNSNASYNTTAENYTEIIRESIKNIYQEVLVDTDLIGQSGKLNEEKISSVLKTLSMNKAYLEMKIVNIDGKGYDNNGNKVDVSDKTYFINARKGSINASNWVYSNSLNPSAVICSVPIMSDHICKGVFIVNINITNNILKNIQKEDKEHSCIYILNQNKDLVAAVKGSNAAKFKYDKLTKNGFFYKEFPNQNIKMKVSEFFYKEKAERKGYIWYEKPLGINRWIVLIGKPQAINPITKNILRLTNIMWIFMILSVFLIFYLLINSQIKSNTRIIRMLHLDPVTGGGNWYKFKIDVNKLLYSKAFSKKKFALINFDINRFKMINDDFGYQKGDEILKDIYQVINKWVRPGECCTRYAADQFYILMGFSEEVEVKDRLNLLNSQLQKINHTKGVKFYFGVYYITKRDESIDRMADFANMAKHNIKNQEEAIVAYFDDRAKKELLEKEKIESTMYDALRNNEFIVYLQPKVTAKEAELSGAEALVRWQKGNGTLISPGNFIPIFEKNGFITKLDNFMLRRICEIIRDWLDKGYQPKPISVNISRINFSNPKLAQIIKSIVDDYHIPYGLIELELTESAFLQNKELLINTVNELRMYGFLVSMDDFGAGYSSLNALKDIPLDVIKLDGELFHISQEVERGNTVIRNTIQMAKDLHMKVVAECIETREQVDFLCTLGCDIIQGFYFAKPMPFKQFEEKYYL